MAVEPDGILSLPIHYLRQTVAASGTFQTWVDADTAGEAANRVHAVLARTLTMPLAVVDWAKNFGRTKDAGGTRNFFVQEGGDLALLFRAAVDAEHDDVDAAYTFLNTVGAVVTDIEGLAGKAGYLNITSIALDDGPYRPSEDEEKTVGDYYEIVFRIGFE